MPRSDIEAPDWDEDAIEEAEYRARAIEPFDPDAAASMREMAAAAKAKLTGQTVAEAARTPYDPMAMFAYVAKYYGFSDSEMDRMHFAKFFGYIRQANEMNEAEKAEYDRLRRQQTNTTTPEQALGMFPVAQKYEGETVAL